jgi:hypothetical protein
MLIADNVEYEMCCFGRPIQIPSPMCITYWRLNLIKLKNVNLATNDCMDELYNLCLTNYVAPEPEGSSPHSQQPANGPYPEPGESTPHPPNQSP